MNKAWWKPKTLLSDRWIPEITLKNGKLMSWFLQPRKVTVDLCKSCMTRIRIKDYIPLSPKNFFNWFCGRSLSHMWKKQVSSVQWSQPLCQSVLLVDEEGIRKQVLLKKSGKHPQIPEYGTDQLLDSGCTKLQLCFVDGRNPAPVAMATTRWFTSFCRSQLVHYAFLPSKVTQFSPWNSETWRDFLRCLLTRKKLSGVPCLREPTMVPLQWAWQPAGSTVHGTVVVVCSRVSIF